MPPPIDLAPDPQKFAFWMGDLKEIGLGGEGTEFKRQNPHPEHHMPCPPSHTRRHVAHPIFAALWTDLSPWEPWTGVILAGSPISTKESAVQRRGRSVGAIPFPRKWGHRDGDWKGGGLSKLTLPTEMSLEDAGSQMGLEERKQIHTKEGHLPDSSDPHIWGGGFHQSYQVLFSLFLLPRSQPPLFILKTPSSLPPRPATPPLTPALRGRASGERANFFPATGASWKGRQGAF